MKAATVIKPLASALQPRPPGESYSSQKMSRSTASLVVSRLEQLWVDLRLGLVFLHIAWKSYRSLFKIRAALKGLNSFRDKVYGAKAKWRYFKVDGRYHFGIYIPRFPSTSFSQFVQTQMNWALPHKSPVNRFQSVHLAITNSCPLQCEHCYEWENLNREETFTTDELKAMITALQEEGCTQLHFTGGEPMVKMNRLEALVRHASGHSECWINTSGLNLTLANALRLKQAGLTGVVVSLDHFEPDIHNAFRGSEHAFDWAIKAVRNANEAKLVTAFSICLTRSFVTEENMMRFAELAASSGVAFVQLLEPKVVGHYAGKDIKLSDELLELAGKFYLNINFNTAFRDYPVFVYHGYYQRKLGCVSGGSLSLYIDSAGFINACPFCHTKSLDARDILTGDLKVSQIQMPGCPVFAK